MGSDVRVFVFDDKQHAETGQKVEASHVGVPLAFGGKNVLLDLGDDNYDLLAGLLRPWLKAGHPPGKVNTGTRQSGRHPRAYYEALRAYIAERTGEELQPDADGKYDYPGDLRRDFEASLTQGT
jgi:hypothetical protein